MPRAVSSAGSREPERLAKREGMEPNQSPRSMVRREMSWDAARLQWRTHIKGRGHPAPLGKVRERTGEDLQRAVLKLAP